MWVCICVSSLTPALATRNAFTAHRKYAFHLAFFSGSPSRNAGSSIWIMPMPACFQIGDFVADGKRELERSIRARLIVTHERPHQHRYRAGQHAFDRLGVSGFAHTRIQSTVIGCGR